MDGWEYSALIAYTESSTQNPYKFYVKRVTVLHESFMRQDFGDIRFTDEDETEDFYYALVEKTDGVQAVFDVRIPSLALSATGNIKIHAGNTNAVSESDPRNTYLLHDNFEDGLFRHRSEVLVSSDPTKYESWPSLAKLSNGDILLTYRKGNSNVHNYVADSPCVLRKSFNNGDSWSSESVVCFIDDMDIRDGGTIVFDDNGTETIIRIVTVLSSIGHYSVHYVKSVDGGNNWSSPVMIRDNRVSIGNPVMLSNGTILFGTYSLDNDVYIEKSSDNGDTWTEQAVSGATNHNESTFLEVKNSSGEYSGNVIGILRSFDKKFYKITSSNYGTSWTAPVAIAEFPINTDTKGSLCRLGNDTIGFIYTNYDIILGVSYDEGATWKMQNVYALPPSYSTYPDILMADNEILIAWCDNGSSSSDIHSKRFRYADFEIATFNCVGTLAIESSNPIKGSYSLKHTGGGGTSQALDYSTGGAIYYPMLNNCYIEFDMKVLNLGAYANAPYLQLFQLNGGYNGLNVLSLTTWYASGKQNIRITKIVSGSVTTYGTAEWLDHQLGVNDEHHFKILATPTHINVWIDEILVVNTDITYTWLQRSAAGMTACRDGVAEWDTIKIYPYISPEPSLGEIGEWTGEPVEIVWHNLKLENQINKEAILEENKTVKVRIEDEVEEEVII